MAKAKPDGYPEAQSGLLLDTSGRFVKDSGEVLKVWQPVEVTVLAVDLERKRISLTMKKNPEREGKPADQPKTKENRENQPVVGEGPRPKIAQGKPPQERQEQGRPQREKPGQGRPKPGKPRAEKVPFNNPFAALLGKKKKIGTAPGFPRKACCLRNYLFVPSAALRLSVSTIEVSIHF